MASSPTINRWNEQWRSSPEYARIFQQVGAQPGMRLSDEQRRQVQMLAEQAFGMRFPKGVEIDPAGNMNENEGFGKQAKRYGPIVGAGALAAFGIPGLFPGLVGGGGGAAAGGAAASQAGSAGGALASYGPSAAMQAANMSMAPIGAYLGGGGLAGAIGGAAAGAAGGLSGAQIARQAAGAAAGGSPWRTVLDSLMRYGPTALAGGAAIRGMTQGPTDAEKQLAEIMRMAQGRMEQSQPLFEALNRMAMSGLPKYARGEQ